MAGYYLVARWESERGAHIVELHKARGSGYYYRATGAGGYLGNDYTTDEQALAEFAPRVARGEFLPDTARRPMKRVR